MKGSIFALQLLGLLQLCKSQTSCTSDVAVPLDNVANSGSGSDSGASPGDVALASYQVAGASAIVDLTGTNLNEGGSGGFADLIDIGSDPPLRRLLRKRAGLECTSSESCYSLQGGPFCANDETDDFRLEDGTTGNLNTGDYTLPDGQQGNLNTGPYPTLSASSFSTTFDASAASATGSSDSFTITDAGGSADPTAASTSDASTPTGNTGSTLAAETVASTGDTSTPTESADPTSAGETEASSPTRTSARRGSASAASSANPSAQGAVNAAGAPARCMGSNFALLAIMGLRAIL